MMLYTRW